LMSPIGALSSAITELAASGYSLVIAPLQDVRGSVEIQRRS